MKLTREMLDINPKEGGQDCETCPFNINGVSTCIPEGENYDLSVSIDRESNRYPTCSYHSIQLKTEYLPFLDV